MSEYLYGASIQGIQDFIFKTNRLKEIVGASEIVKNITENFLRKFEKDNDVDILLCAAGNIKAVFKDKGKLEKHVLEFEKEVRQSAYGITVSQAVTLFNDDYDKDIETLEKKLKTQRNKPSIPLDLSIGIMELAPSTGRPIIDKNKKNDMATIQKSKAYDNWFDKHKKEHPEIKELKDISQFSNKKNKIAVIHIDGNGLGKIVPKLKENLPKFSKRLDNATKKSFFDAIDKIFKGKRKQYRDIILGGDDVTLIINADYALEFTKEFLQNFEKNTAEIEELKEIEIDGHLVEKLTACAGIAYCNEKYPFHYAVSLAEELCKEAKKRSNRENSCLMFHNIQSSNFQSWEKLVEDELIIENEKYKKSNGNDNRIRLDFGPYYLDKSSKIDDFLKLVEAYKSENSPISKLRDWLTQLDRNNAYAEKLLKRISDIFEKKSKREYENINALLKLLQEDIKNEKLIDDNNKCPVYDILQIISVKRG